MRASPYLLVAGLTATLAAATADAQVLVVAGPSRAFDPSLLSVTAQLTASHNALGSAVTVVDLRPGDLTPYRQIWDVRYSDNADGVLTGADQDAYVAFLRGGGGLFVVGENRIFNARNASVFGLIAAAGGGAVGFYDAGTREPQAVCAPFDAPSPVAEITYRDAGHFDGRGTGQWITAPSCDAAAGGNGLAFAPGRLANAPAGTLAAVLDVNFLQTDAGPNGVSLARNLVGYVTRQVAPITTVPEPSALVLLTAGCAGVAIAATHRRAR